MTEIATSDATFEKDVVEKSKEIPVIVDFYADWCPPCQILKPILQSLTTSEIYHDKILLAKLDVEQNKQKAIEYGVSGIPDVRMFKDGKVVSRFTGAIPESAVKEWIDKNL